MDLAEPKSMRIKEAGERSNWDFHFRLSNKEKQRLEMLTKANNYPTISSFIKGQIFQPDLHAKIDFVISKLKKMEEKADAEERSRKISRKKS
jgi:hypothetical protein